MAGLVGLEIRIWDLLMGDSRHLLRLRYSRSVKYESVPPNSFKGAGPEAVSLKIAYGVASFTVLRPEAAHEAEHHNDCEDVEQHRGLTALRRLKKSLFS